MNYFNSVDLGGLLFAAKFSWDKMMDVRAYHGDDRNRAELFFFTISYGDAMKLSWDFWGK